MSDYFNPFQLCKNCSTGIHPDFSFCPICKIDNPFDNITCFICLDIIPENEKIKLNCKHYLHKKCYYKLLINKNYYCPVCKVEFLPSNINCGICLKAVNLNESECDIFKSLQCKCFFHYKCLKIQKNNICKNCEKIIDCQEIKALSYNYLLNGYCKWVGRLPRCKFSNCFSKCNPRRFGFCQKHNSKYFCSKRTMKLSLMFFTRYIYENNEINRQKIFELIILFFNEYYSNKFIHKFNFMKIKEEFENYIINY